MLLLCCTTAVQRLQRRVQFVGDAEAEDGGKGAELSLSDQIKKMGARITALEAELGKPSTHEGSVPEVKDSSRVPTKMDASGALVPLSLVERMRYLERKVDGST